MAYKVDCNHANEYRRYNKDCHTCKNNKYKPKPDFYKPTTSKIIVDWLVYILLITGIGIVAVLACAA